MTESTTVAPIVRELTVRCAPERAWETFTERMHVWWPLEEHSIAGSEGLGAPGRVVVEPRVGGRVYEVRADGGEATGPP